MQQPMTIAMVISKSLIEPRTHRMAVALSRHGYSIQMLTWDRSCRYQKFEDHKDYQVHRLRLKGATGTFGVFSWPFWWLRELAWLFTRSWDVAHAINFDTVVPAVIAAKLRRKHVIYEIFDVLEDSIKLPTFARRACLFIDRLFMYMADAVIIADDSRLEQIGGALRSKKVVTVLNAPEEIVGSGNFIKKRLAPFTIFYGGTIFPERFRGLIHVVEAIEGLNDIRLVVAGWGAKAGEFQQIAKKSSGRIVYLGMIDHQEVIRWSLGASLIIALYDPSLLQNRYASPNKLFEAMMCGVPILVSRGTTMDKIVEREKCGLIVGFDNIPEIREAILKLKDHPQMQEELGANGSRAYEQRYSWKLMEQRLLGLFSEISGNAGINPRNSSI